MKKLVLALAGLILATVAGPALADSPADQWVVRAGISVLTLSNKLDLTVAGAQVPGAELSTVPQVTPTVQIGYYVMPHVVLMATVGLPPHIGLRGGGAIAPYGELGQTTYGPTALTMQFHPFRAGMFRPYVGVGGSYMIIFSTKDGAVHNLKLGNDLAPAFEVGSDVMLNPRYGLFLDVKKALLQSTSTGTLGPYPINGKASIAPFVVSSGVTLRF